MSKSTFLFIIVFFEGYIALSSELLFIRQLTPFIGNNIEIISIIISAVLLPLSIGYYYGGNIINKSYKNKLSLNLIFITLFLHIGMSYILLKNFFELIKELDILIQATIYSLLFIVYPFFLLGQTIPLISVYFKSEILNKFTGKLLFSSTFGSFVGSIFTTLFLMNYIGVNNTLSVNIMILFFIFIILNKNKIKRLIMFFVTFGLLFLNSSYLIKSKYNIVLDNSYGIIEIIENDKYRIFNNNNSFNSIKNLKTDTNLIWYVNKTNKLIEQESKNRQKLKILVIGSGGFQIGDKDYKNEYTFIDINKDILKISELYFNEHPLEKNKKFISISTRNFFNKNKEKKYDFIILDAYTNSMSIPYQLLTEEFLLKVKLRLNKNGIFISNIISSPFFKNEFSIKIHNTFNKVFYPIFRFVPDNINLNKLSDYKYLSNIMYLYKNDNIIIENNKILTDDKNH